MSIDPTLIIDDRPRTLAKVIKQNTIWPRQEEETILVICHRKAHFVEQLAHEISIAKKKARRKGRTDRSMPHLSLNLLQSQIGFQLFYCPNLTTFRAFAATLPLREDDLSDTPNLRIVVVDMLALHYGTSEFNVQGLSRSLAMLASVQHSIQCRMELVECTDVRDRKNPGRGRQLWNTDVPLLSTSLKIADAGKQWGARTSKIRDFADRWFDFVKGDDAYLPQFRP